MVRCKLCNKVKSDSDFYAREDRTGPYAFCIQCCKEQGRTPEYPPEKDRGAGVIRPNYKSLRAYGR